MILFNTIYCFVPYLQSSNTDYAAFIALNKALVGFTLALFLAFVYQLLYFKPIKKFFVVVTALIPLLFSVTQVVVKAVLGANLNFSILDLVTGTNLGEVKGFIQLYVDWQVIALVLLALLPFFLAYVFRKYVRSFAVYLLRHHICLITCLIIIVFFWVLFMGINLSNLFARAESPITWSFRYAKTFVSLDLYAAALLKEGAFRAEITKNESTIPNVILVVGESASTDYMSIYGYEMDTTPVCANWEKNGNLAVFHDVISSNTLTKYTVPTLISFIGGDKTSGLSDSTANNIFDIFSQCGYKTFWLSNQDRDTTDTLYMNFTSDFLADHSKYYAGSRFAAYSSKKFSAKDGVLVEDFIKKVEREKEASGKKLYLLHLLGSHAAYNLRYPAEFERWTASDLADEPLKEDMKQRVAEYLNSIYYTDYLLGQMMEKLNYEESIILYVSDHGEELGQNGQYRGHILLPAVSQAMFRIPFLIWMSDKFIENNPEKSLQIMEAAEESKPWMSDSLPHLLLDIANIETTQYKPEMSVINPAFVVKERKILGINYEDFEP
ncbi:MAG: phosphoethanolamine transferase [Candidatus Riflebacteria bacterium]|nr:phosphoethanolamine transferase [Candidatus Riflebacteria bacterium]